MNTYKTERLILRPLIPEDAHDVYEYMGNTDNTALTRAGVQSYEECCNYIKEASHIPYIFAVVHSDKVIGTTEITLCEDNQGELGWIIHRDYWGKGYCTEIGIHLLKIAFEEIKLRRVFAHCDELNIGSWRVMEKIGMKREGVSIEGRCEYRHSPHKHNNEYSYGITSNDYFLRNCVISIREAKGNDFSVLSEYDKHISSITLEEKIRSGQILIAEADGNFAGWLRYGYFWDEIPFMNMLYVIGDFRNRKIGKALVEAWENKMLQNGFSQVMTSSQSDEYAQHFYRRLGYRDLGGFTQTSGEYEIIFGKDIS